MDGNAGPLPARLPALVVDDDAFVRKVFVQQLRSLGLSDIASAADGLEAQNLLRNSGPYSLILFDLVMPGYDGFELLREIAEHQPRAALVMVSSADPRVLRTVQQLAQLRKLHVLGALSKPVRVADLQALLARMRDYESPRVAAPATTGMTAGELRDALRDGQIDVHVQPIVDLHTLRLHGVEALARCTHPAHRFASPEQFITLAEATGQILELTLQVTRRILRVCAQWRSEGLEPHVAVNLSMACLTELDLPERLLALTETCHFNPKRLSLEITESGLAADTARSLDILGRLRLRGIELSIDDFGTGYSSLQQLQRIPFTQLKVDRSFVSRAVEDVEARHIVEANIRLAQRLRLCSVAEGVETPAQLELLKRLGCDLAQGYLFAKPMPIDDFPGWARRFALQQPRSRAALR